MYRPPDDMYELLTDIQWLMWCGDEVYAQTLLINFADKIIKESPDVEEKE